MATFKFEGLQELERKLNSLGAHSQEVAGRCVYAAAAIVADEVRKSLDGLKAVSDRQALAAYRRQEPGYLSESQKAGLREGLGLATMLNDAGYIHTKLGFDGYNSVKSKRWPKGQPNVMIARSCENGSSAMLRQRFIAPGVSRARRRAEAEMAKVFDEETEKIMK